MNLRIRACAVVLCIATAMPVITNAQSPSTKDTAASPQTKKVSSKTAARDKAEASAATERQPVAIALINSLADEARSFHDETLRARVQARAADVLWTIDSERARALFRRAWDSADATDKENARRAEEARRAEQARPSSSGTGSQTRELMMVGGSTPNLRGEVLHLAAGRDRALSEELLAKLTDSTARENADLSANADNSSNASNTSNRQPSLDPEKPSPAVEQRLRLARQFLEDGDAERAMQFADKALYPVTVRSINFLSALREKNQAAADERFATLLASAASDARTDAATVSVLSSYAFTPFLNLLVRSDGNNHTMQEREHIVAPQMSAELRAAFFRTAAQILLRPIPPAEEDHTIAGRAGLYFVLARLLPLFEQYAPTLAPDIRAQISVVSPDAPESLRSGNSKMLTRGLTPEETSGRDEGQDALDKAERAATPEERDQFYIRAALTAARKGDAHARDLVDKITDTESRKSARAFVDFTLIDRSIRKDDGAETLRLTRTAELPNIHRAWALTESARLMKKTDPTRAAEILGDAATEARRIGGSDPDRARALVGVATQMYEIDRSRVWEIIAEVVKAANANAEFSGDDAQIVSRLVFGQGASTTNFTVESFDLNGIFSKLAKDDLYRAVETAKSFTNESPRANASLAIVRSVLEEKPKPATKASRG
jgi:hypothetical protein